MEFHHRLSTSALSLHQLLQILSQDASLVLDKPIIIKVRNRHNVSIRVTYGNIFTISVSERFTRIIGVGIVFGI